jgi:N-acetylglutamate synthase-like GNAT family acetyltransferase/cephalosporin hydroxylase
MSLSEINENKEIKYNNNINVAFVMNASILPDNNKIKQIGTSQGYSQGVKCIFEQLVILVNSIRKNIKSFKYEIHIFSTYNYNELYTYILRDCLKCNIYIVSPDIQEKEYSFFARSKTFTHDLKGESPYTHRIVLDTDMYFVRDINIDFNYDIMMTYMPDYYEFNENSKNKFKNNMLSKIKNNYNIKPFNINDKPLIYQYINNIDYIQIFPPVFNGGFYLVKESLCKKFGKEYFKYFNTPFVKNKGMFLQNNLGFCMLSTTNNWSSTPIGINYFGEFNNCLDTDKYKNKITLVHYLGDTFNKYLKYNLYDSNYEFIYSIIYTHEINDMLFKEICLLKNLFWNYGLISQQKWFIENINSNDKHYIIYHINKIIGYAALRDADNYYILDSVIIHNDYKRKGFGKKLIVNVIKNINKPIYLLCEEDNIKFYEKCNFEINNNISFIDKNTEKFSIMSLNDNIKENKKILYHTKKLDDTYSNITLDNSIKYINISDIYSSNKFKISYEIVKYTYENLLGRECPQYKIFGNLSHHINIPLFDLINGEVYVEIGTHYGHSLSTLAHTFSNKIMIGIDIFDQNWFVKHGSKINNVFKLAFDNIMKFNNNNKVSLIKGYSYYQKTIDNVKNKLNGKEIDLLYIDGDHSYNGVIYDFESYFNLVKKGGLIVFDDYLPQYNEPFKAINDLCNKYALSLNIIGLTEDKYGYNNIKPCQYLKDTHPNPKDKVYNMSYIVQKMI